MSAYLATNITTRDLRIDGITIKPNQNHTFGTNSPTMQQFLNLGYITLTTLGNPISQYVVLVNPSTGLPYSVTTSGGGGGGIYGIPNGYQQITNLSSASSLTIPNGTNVAYVVAENGDVRWRDDGTAPTGNTGMLLYAGAGLPITGDLSVIQFINMTGNTSVLNISYYK